jgi:hypothetical protein
LSRFALSFTESVSKTGLKNFPSVAEAFFRRHQFLTLRRSFFVAASADTIPRRGVSATLSNLLLARLLFSYLHFSRVYQVGLRSVKTRRLLSKKRLTSHRKWRIPGGRMSEEMSERIANVAEFKAMKDDSKPFLGNGGSVGKHDTYPPSLQKWSLPSLM